MIEAIPAGSSFSVKTNNGTTTGGKTITKSQTWSTNIKSGLATTYKDNVYALGVAIAAVLQFPVLGIYVKDNCEIVNE